MVLTGINQDICSVHLLLITDVACKKGQSLQGKGDGLFLGRPTRGLLQECKDLVLNAHQTNEGNRRQWGDGSRGFTKHIETEKHSGVAVLSWKRSFPLRMMGL